MPHPSSALGGGVVDWLRRRCATPHGEVSVLPHPKQRK
ncbi:unnamed protein product [Spirodela intermedia]|uniref:Uncharacterized protein n=1 Tax=Spirodela intermedia TaxID=51605 RepID=A0A7I8IAZ1_SPIIN|nr:unnamed protein product [Spirodela intermedia]CAA6654865.1 unnamed protein product [Spirodela intermedia]